MTNMVADGKVVVEVRSGVRQVVILSFNPCFTEPVGSVAEL